MRYTKADIVLLAVFLSPILLVASLFGLGSISWATNRMRINSQVQELIGNATDEDAPTLESIFIPGDESAEELQVRRSNQAKWDELVLSFWFISRWLDSLTTMEEANNVYRIVPPNDSSQLTQDLSQLYQRTDPLLKQLDQLIASPNSSLSQTMSDRIQYDGVGRGDLESVPIYQLFVSCHLALRQSIVDGNQDQALHSMERFLNLMIGQPSCLGAIIYAQGSLKPIRESLVFDFWSAQYLQKIHDRLGKPMDFSKATQKFDLTKALLFQSALQDSKKLPQLDWVTRNISNALDPQYLGQQTIAPSQMLRVIDLLSPETDASHPAGYGLPFGFDRWLNRPGMQAIDLKVHWIVDRNHYRTTAEFAEKDRVFTRAAVAMRMIRLQTGSYPTSLDALASQQWSEDEIAEAKKLLEIEEDLITGEVTLTAIYADWMKDGDGQLVDGGFSKQVRFVD